MKIERVGVIGGGQLAWMMAGAAQKLGIELVIQTPKASDPAAAIAKDVILAAIDDAQATAELAQRCEVITFENEFVNLDALGALAEQGVCFRPRLGVLAPVLDKYHQRCYLRDIGLPVPKFLAWENNGEDIEQPLGWPVVVKARRHGYDGQGTFIIQDPNEFKETLAKLGDTPVLLEEFIPFERELAAIAARSVDGQISIYPIVETQQEAQVCRRVFAPAKIELSIAQEIEVIARNLLENLQAVGIFGIELFLTASGQVLVNEIAPRTHNSGHFSLDACETSQFEQHLRAVAGLSLGDPSLQNCRAAVMVNLLGYEHSQQDYHAKREQIAQIEGARVHWYGKGESRPGRKLGHVTVLVTDEVATPEKLNAIAQQIEQIWYPSTPLHP